MRYEVYFKIKLSIRKKHLELNKNSVVRCKHLHISRLQFTVKSEPKTRRGLLPYSSGVRLLVWIKWQLKCEAKNRTSQGASDGRHQMVFVSKCCMSRGQSPSGNMVGRRLGSPLPLLPSTESINVEIQPLNVPCTTQTWLLCH